MLPHSLALSVAGIFKEICTIVTAVLAMPAENKLTGLNIAGLGVSIMGIAYVSGRSGRIRLIPRHRPFPPWPSATVPI